MKEKLGCIILVLFVLIIIGIVGYLLRSESKYDTKINALTSMEPQLVTVFKIYPRVGVPFGTPVTFQAPDPIIDEFFHALSDRHSYPISRDRIASRDHNWFLEVATEGIPTIQISFLIPSGKGDIVVGRLGKLSETGGSYYGDFQSRELFQWYQTYSHRWLEAGSK